MDTGEHIMAEKTTSSLTIISSFYNTDPVMPALHKLSPNKLILVINGEETDPKAKTEVAENVEKLRSLFSKVMEITVEKADVFDPVATAEKVTKLIEAERKAGSKVIVNVTGGRKILALGVLFGAFARFSEVERIVYGAEFDSQLYDLPKMSFNVGNTKVKILAKLAGKAKLSPAELGDAVGINTAMAYVHLRELKAQGYVNENYEITSAGRLALL